MSTNPLSPNVCLDLTNFPSPPPSNVCLNLTNFPSPWTSHHPSLVLAMLVCVCNREKERGIDRKWSIQSGIERQCPQILHPQMFASISQINGKQIIHMLGFNDIPIPLWCLLHSSHCEMDGQTIRAIVRNGVVLSLINRLSDSRVHLL